MHRPMTTYKVTEKEAGKCYQVTIHDIYCEEERCILTMASLRASTAVETPTSVAIVTCKLEFFDVLANKQNEGEVGFSIVRNQRLERPIPSDAQDEIELHRIRCEVASTLGKASAMANSGKIAAAKDVLIVMQGKVRGSKVAARPLAVHLAETVQESLEGLQDKVSACMHACGTVFTVEWNVCVQLQLHT